MSNQNDEQSEGISDEDLPEDLQPTDDNPLAQPLTDEDPETAEDLDVLGGGKRPEQSDDSDDADETDDSQG
jgi:hypothetical protein